MSQLNTRSKYDVLTAIFLSSTALLNAETAFSQFAPSSDSTRFNYSAPLSSLASNSTDVNSRAIDWRKSTISFNFELPEANLTDNIELLLSANPRGGVNPAVPLTVQFNNDAPVPLKVDGQGFDARITLDPNEARTANNIITISYGPNSTDFNRETDPDKCIGVQDGAWDIDLAQSKLVINSRARGRALQLREIETHLSSPGLAPKTVSLITNGNNAAQLTALAAQGIALRMDTIPDFQTEQRNGDFQVIMARRSELGQYIQDTRLTKGRGAAILIPRSRPVQLVFTGDTDAQILALVKSFAERHLPNARRSVTSLGETRLQLPLGSDTLRLSSSKAFADIPGATSFTNWRGDDWANEVKSLRFDVTDPKAMTGEVILRLASSRSVADTSKLQVRLNGKNLGTTVLDKRRKTVGFKIDAGTLQGKDNVLTLMPEINSDAPVNCNLPSGPNFHLGGGSKIILTNDTPSQITELSRMGATGVPYADSQGQRSYISMPGTTLDFNASLKVLARLAKSSGIGLTQAVYSRSANMDAAGQNHVLYIGPASRLQGDILQNAPRALTSAIRGQFFDNGNQISANTQKFASLDAEDDFKIAARNLSQSNRIRTGGVAALYPSHMSDAHVIGVITNAAGQDYASSADMISQTAYWSEIKGGVARWDKRTVLSVQAPQSVPAYRAENAVETAQSDIFAVGADIIGAAANGASKISAQALENLRRFAQRISGGESNTGAIRQEALPDTSPETLPNTSPETQSGPAVTPKDTHPSKKIIRAKIDGINDGAQREALANTARPSTASGSLFKDSLSRANDWASAASKAAGNKLNQISGNISNAVAAGGAHQSTLQRLRSPAALILILAFLLALCGLLFTGTAKKDEA